MALLHPDYIAGSWLDPLPITPKPESGMPGGPLGSWPEVERRRSGGRRVASERRSGDDRRSGEDRRMIERRQNPLAASFKASLPDRRAGTSRRSETPRRVSVRRSGLDRRLQPLFP